MNTNTSLWSASDRPPSTAPVNRTSIDVTVMNGLGHFVMMEDPDTFNRLLSEIVEEFAGTE